MYEIRNYFGTVLPALSCTAVGSGDKQNVKEMFVNTQVLNDEESDEFAAYFRCEVVPKVLITSSDRSKVVRSNKICHHVIFFQ